MHKKRVLFAWEFGGHLGHVLNMLPLAHALAARGFEVAFALKDLARANLIYARHPEFRLFQAPVWHAMAQGVSGPPQSLAQVLQRNGYKSAEAIEALTRAWLSIYHSVNPDLVVYDYSFTAQLAFRALPATQVTVGSGFFTPAFDQYSPDFWDGITGNRAQLEQDERAVVQVINAVCAKTGRSPVNFLSDLNKMDANFLCTCAELDHYGARQGFHYVGPLQDEGGFPPVQWQHPDIIKKVFAYLKPNDTAERLLSVLGDAACETHLFMPGLPQTLRKKYEGKLMKFSTKPFDMRHAAASADLCICNGGHGTVAAALLQGCALLLVPQQAEQYLMSRRTQALGVSEMIAPDADEQTMRQKLALVMNEPGYRQQARAFAAKYTAYCDGSPAAALAAAIIAVMEKNN